VLLLVLDLVLDIVLLSCPCGALWGRIATPWVWSCWHCETARLTRTA
jgi:hypothetical protein